jgi:hypothetical protein
MRSGLLRKWQSSAEPVRSFTFNVVSNSMIRVSLVYCSTLDLQWARVSLSLHLFRFTGSIRDLLGRNGCVGDKFIPVSYVKLMQKSLAVHCICAG